MHHALDQNVTVKMKQQYKKVEKTLGTLARTCVTLWGPAAPACGPTLPLPSALCPLPPACALKTSIGRASAPGGGRRRSAQAAENPPMCPNLIDLSTNTIKFEGFASFCRMCPGWISRKIHSNSKGLRTFCWISPDLLDFPKNTVKFQGIACFLPDVPGFAGFPEKYIPI